jgi:hypothetical protein
MSSAAAIKTKRSASLASIRIFMLLVESCVQVIAIIAVTLDAWIAAEKQQINGQYINGCFHQSKVKLKRLQSRCHNRFLRSKSEADRVTAYVTRRHDAK